MQDRSGTNMHAHNRCRMPNGRAGETFNCYFWDFFASISKIYILTGALGTIILWSLDTFLIFNNILRSSVLSRSATRSETRICHVDK